MIKQSRFYLRATDCYYYFLGLNIGNEHKSMFYRTLEKHGLPIGKKIKAF